jgi:hypothetical protein
MHSSKVTKGFSIAFLVLYTFWSLTNIGVTGLLFSASIGLIAFGSTDTIELATAITIFSGLLFLLFVKNLKEGFNANSAAIIEPAGPQYETAGYKQVVNSSKGVATDSSPQDIVDRLRKMANTEIKGMYSSSFVEGFADASVVNDPIPDAGSGKEAKKEEIVATSSKTLPSVNESIKVSEQLKKDTPDSVNKNEVFRIGSLPSEDKEGPHIDAGTTMMNALNALKPDQIEAMTTDTRKLLETQKSLMGMLETMKPMLKDGHNLLETFGTMFAKT